MAVADAIAQIYRALFEYQYYQNNLWMRMVRDLSPELEYGGAINLVTSTYNGPGGATNTDRTLDQIKSENLNQHTWPDPVIGSLTNVKFEPDDIHITSELVSAIHERLVRPNILEEKATQAATKMREEVNNDIRDKLNGTTNTTTLAPSITVTAGNFGNAAHATAIDTSMRNMRLELTKWHVPQDNRYMIMSPDYEDILINKIITDRNFFVSGVTDEAAVNGAIGRWRGFFILVDDSVGEGRTNTDDANHTMYAMRPGDALSFARVLELMHTVSPEASPYIGAWMRGLNYYGSILDKPRNASVTKTSIT